MKKIKTALGIWILLALAMLSCAQGTPEDASKKTNAPSGANGYQEPNLTVKLFDVKKITISPDDRKSIASMLGEYVRNQRPITPEQNQINSKCLTVALLLDSENKTAIMANYFLKAGKEPSKVTPETKSETLWEKILALAQKAYESKVDANVQVASNLADLGLMANPQNENAIFLAEMTGKQGIKPVWSVEKTSKNFADGKDASGRMVVTQELQSGYSDAPREFILKQQTVKGLSVRELARDKYAGHVLEIIGTVSPSHNPGSETSAKFTSSQVRDTMQKGLAEAVKAVRQRYPIWERGKNVALSFSDQYVNRDGPSATTACAILILSLLDGFECSPDVAFTGDLSADWRVQAVGAVGGKIRGAMKQNVNIVVIPRSTISQVKDWLLLEPVYSESLSKIQIFAIDSLEEAVELARKDRSENLTLALKKLAEIQRGLKLQNYYPKSGNAQYKAKLEEVLKLAPNCLSAQLLLEIENSEEPKFLSASASAGRLLAIADPFFSWCQKTSKESVESSMDRFHFGADVYAQAIRELNDVQFKLDQRSVEFAEKIRTMVERFKELDATLQGTPATSRTDYQIKQCRETYKAAISVYDETRESLRILMGDENFVEDFF